MDTMREKLLTLLLVPFLVLPVLLIAAGGDVELLWRELVALTQAPIVLTAFAGTSPMVTPSGPVGPGGGPAGAPLLTGWGMISASIMLALVALWALNRRLFKDDPPR